MRSLLILTLIAAAFAAAPILSRNSSPAGKPAQGEWRYYGADAHSSKYTATSQIHRSNVAKLKVAWRWSSPDNLLLKMRPKAGVGYDLVRK